MAMMNDMAISERAPLLNEKSGRHFEHSDFEQGNWRQSLRRTRSNRGRFSTSLVSLLCASALLGSYVLCKSLQKTSTQSEDDVRPAVTGDSLTSNYTCVPGQACWPSSAQWQSFNQSIGGNLRMTVPFAAPCYSNSTGAECLHVARSYGNSNVRSNEYGAMEFLDWEACGESQCLLNSLKPDQPVQGECSLGRLSTYHVEAQTADDIQKTLMFVQEHGIRVSIKNTGHDYFGRSNSPNSLAIWTHKMKELKYHKTFQPQGCKTQYDNIGEVGAGVQAQDAWEYFEPLNMLVTVGAVGSVGIAGGFGQGGGHGPLGPKYGLMVDQAVEFDVITADGKMRTINECTDPDLFWAMRGGGGGNYAVLVSYKFQLHPAVPINVYSFQAKFPTSKGALDLTQSQVHRDILTSLAQNQTLFAEHGIAGYNFIHKDKVVMLQVIPSTDRDAIKKVTAQWRDYLSNYPNLTIGENKYYSFDKFSDWHKLTETPEVSRNGPVGLGLMMAGRFIPRSLFATDDSIDKVVDAVLTAMQFSYTNKAMGSAQLYSTGPWNHPDNSKTGVNAAWRTSLWHVIMGAPWISSTAPAVRTHLQKTVSASIEPFKALTPGGGSYMNEGDWSEENWQQTFFGDNYGRLLDVKRRYDPTGFFNCWKCVGWTGYDDPMYSCYSQSRRTPQPSIPLGPVG